MIRLFQNKQPTPAGLSRQVFLDPQFSAHNRLVLGWESETPCITCGQLSNPEALVRLRSVCRSMPEGREARLSRVSEEELLLAVAGLPVTSGSAAAGGFNTGISPIDPESPVRTVIAALITEARNRGASDIHLELEKTGLRVRLRCDGVLQPVRSFDPACGAAILSALKVLAGLNIMEKRRPQEGRFSQATGMVQSELRVSIVPTIDGESAVLRFLENGAVPPALSELGFDKTHVKLLEAVPGMPAALVLICGPTGCGKSTTAAALLAACDRRGRKVISIEDPVEYRLDDITQVRIGGEAGVSLTEALPKVLRQDPDVLMIGEIRDEDTCALAVQAAMTGHLVISTVHTATAAGALERLVELGAGKELAAEVLQAVISQRLVRKPCVCTGTVKGSSGTGEYCSGTGENCSGSTGDCPRCGGTGWKGRIPVAECLFRGSAWGVGLSKDIAQKVAAGLTAGSEIARVYGAEP